MVEDNLAVLRLFDQKPAGPYTFEDLEVLGRWHGWGAAPHVFDQPEWADVRDELGRILGSAAYAAAAKTTLNAHYTDPRLVDALWSSLAALGVHGGVVLEPGCGAGGVLASAGPGWRGLGVELDPTTAKVAAARLGPQHEIVSADFGRLPLNQGVASAVVGNVPFGSIRIYDPVYNPDRALSIHDHFLVKSAAALAPGGVAAVITSRYTLDSRSSTSRRAIGEHADFLGAVRLPDAAHQAFAGTRVVTDLVILRGRPADQPADHAAGFLDPPVSIDDAGEVRMSAYFAVHEPGQVLGVPGVRSSQYGPQLAITSSGSWHEGLAPAISHVAAAAGRAPAPPDHGHPLDLQGLDPDANRRPLGRLERSPSGVFRRCGPDGWEPHSPGTARDELAALIQLRDGAQELVDAEQDPQLPDQVVEDRRKALADRYTAYVDQYGPINRVTITSTGQRRAPSLGGFRKDPGWPRVAALEVYDIESGAAAPAALLQGRLLEPASPPTSARSPADALAISLQHRARVDSSYIADLLGLDDPSQVPQTLGDLAYEEPSTHRLVDAATYLSGNVRAKLDTARAAAREDPQRWDRNVAALEAVLPRDVTANELHGLLGAPWIPRETVAAFAHQLARVDASTERVKVQHSVELGRWSVNADSSVTWRLGADHPFGTSRRDALALLQDGLNGVQPTVWDRHDDGSRTVNADATEAARATLAELRDHFDTWLLLEDPERSRALLATYNERFNSSVPRDYSGMEIATPGLRKDFKLRPHQHAAVARMIHGGDSLLAHPVGAGKTAEMIVGAMELRRTGAINRAAFVVPNHMLEQFGRDIVDLYPGAQVLVIDKGDLNPRGRAEFAARAQAHDWDAVVVTLETFKRWPLSPGVEQRILESKLQTMRADLLAVAGQAEGKTLTKQLQQRIANQEERLKALEEKVTRHDDHHDLYFDQAGVDYLCVDEAHAYKKLTITSAAGNLRGVPRGDGSAVAEGLANKLTWLRETRPGRPVVTLATGTPITNTVAEMWVMGKLVRPDLLDELGISSFDAFRQQFCETVSAMELDPSGTKLREITRLARYENLPELARWWGEFTDVVQVEDLGLPRPALAGGTRQIIDLEPPPGLVDYMLVDVARRADAIKGGQVEASEDNMLKLTSDCRMASFDWAGFSGDPEDPATSTLAACADRVAAIHDAHAERTYRSASGATHPRPGAFQLVFADLGTPKRGNPDTAYARLKAMLVARGIPEDSVQFAHDHDGNDTAKARFFEACRDGRVAVAISSTAKMGVGTNVQDRLVALHHLDCPWRPSDVEQREGRILRQGNQNDEVSIHAYVVRRGAAVWGWQTLERKAGFIGQVMRATPDGPRSIEVGDDEALSYGEIKAIATGDPDFLRAAELESTVARLERLARVHGREISAAQRRAVAGEKNLAHLDRRIAILTPVAARVAGVDPDAPWRIAVDGTDHTNRADAARAISDLTYRQRESQGDVLVARLPDSDLQIRFMAYRDGAGGAYSLATSDGVPLARELVQSGSIDEQVGALRRIENDVWRVPDALERSVEERKYLLEDIAAAKATSEAGPFKHHDELQAARRSLVEINERLAARYGEQEQAEPSPTPSPQPPTPEELVHRTRTARSASDQRVAQAPTQPSRPGVDFGR